jgi:hypothetical protein
MIDNEPTPRCALASCRAPFLPSQPGQKYCSRKHARTAEKQRQRERKNFGETVKELVPRRTGAYDRDSQDWRDDPSQFSDYGDVPGDLDDEDGIYAGDSTPDPWQQRAEAFHEQIALSEAIDRITAEYEARLRPYRDTMKRNPGVKPVAMARLEQERDSKIRDLTRAADKAQALETAARMAPQRAVQAAERQLEQAALNAFGRDLPGGSRRYQPPVWTGRPTDGIAVW